MITQWQAWIAAFDQTVADDDWGRLASFLTEDVVYAVTGAPFACELRGRDAVIAGFAKSIANFDRKFDRRAWHAVGVREWHPNGITGRAMGRYRLRDLPELAFSAQSLWLFRGEQICLMTDVYDMAEADVQAALGWIGEHGAGMDASYA